MDQQLAIGDADPAYVSCMFCTARCFKLHGSHGGCAAASSSSPARDQIALQAGAKLKDRNSSRKPRAPFFVKTVKITTVRRKNCELHLPAFFFKDYGDRFQKFVLLQGPNGQVWPVNLCVSCGSTTGRPTVRFSRGWKEFANDHRLELGDKLIFTLASFSRFSVQVFDPLGKTKPTSSNAVSGWSFRREDSQNDDLAVSGQKRSIFVNWQNKVVRESSLGLGSSDRSKKEKVSGSRQASRVAMLYRHLQGENKTLEKRNALVAKFQAHKRAQSVPLSLLDQKWSNGGDSTSSSDELFNLNDEQADDATNLLEWEPLETASPSQLWPLALKSNNPSKALVTTQQLRCGGDSGTQSVNILSITSSPSSPPRDDLEDHEQGHSSASSTDQDEDEVDPFQVFWKHNKESATSEAPTWPTEEIRHNAAFCMPLSGAQVLNVRPISTLEAPKEIEAAPSPTLFSILHCLEPLSREAVSSRNGQDSCESLQSPKYSDQGIAARMHMENRGPRTAGCSDNLSVYNSSVTDVSLANESDYSRQKELALPCKRSGKVNLKPRAETNRSEIRAASSVLTERDPNRPKASIPIPSICTISPPKYEYKPALPCRKEVGIAEYLEQKCVARKSRSQVRKVNSDCGVGNVALSQGKAVSSKENMNPYVDASSKFQLDSSSKKRSQMSSEVISAPREDKARKMGGIFNLLERAPTPHTKIGSENRCDLVELDGIASDDDEYCRG
ncbi:hypothetical protein M758_5G028600 [Ceratodon purpureus]|nr:hypothetical protein M758_5G028600 [Ceratodon purpureus]